MCMKTIIPSTPTQANYRILELIEQLVSVVPKGTALGLSDLASAMFSGYFIESGGAVTPAIEALYEMVMMSDVGPQLKGDETIVVKGVTVAVQKETDRMRKLEFLQMTANPMDMQIMGIPGRAAVLQDVAEELGMKGKKVVPSPEELKSMMQPTATGGAPGGPSQLSAPAEPRNPAMQAREGQENVTRGVTQ